MAVCSHSLTSPVRRNTPLLVSLSSLNSRSSTKLPYFAFVQISSPPSATESTPSSIFHAFGLLRQLERSGARRSDHPPFFSAPASLLKNSTHLRTSGTEFSQLYSYSMENTPWNF